jgi:hypothetical protein
VRYQLGERRQWCQSYPATPESVPETRHDLVRFVADAGAPSDRVSDELNIVKRPEGATELRMRFALSRRT